MFATRTISALGIALSLFAPADAAPPLDLKGLRFGTPLDQAKAVFPMDCERINPINERFLHYELECKSRALKSYGGVRVEAASLKFRGGLFVAATITLPEWEAGNVREAVMTKYGPPSEEHGAPLSATEGCPDGSAEWILADGRILIHRGQFQDLNVGCLSASSIVHLSSREQDEFARMKEKGPPVEQRARDL